MDNKIKEMYRDAKQVHKLLYTDLKELERKFQSHRAAEKVDIIYGLKQTVALLEDLRKQIEKLRKRFELDACAVLTSYEQDSIRTEYCSAKVSVKQYANYPHKRRNDPDKFDKLMTALGIPTQMIESEGVRLNWEGFSAWFTKRQAEGLPLPDGISPEDVYTEITLSTRKLKEVDE